MADRVSTPNDQSVGALIKDIVGDLEKLTKQQFKMFRSELKDDLQKTEEGVTILSGGLMLILVGAVLLGIMCGELLNSTGLERWAAYGLVGVVAACIGAILCYAGRQKFKGAVPPAETSVEALEENVKCLTHPK
jgi:uncharacterized membrane protein YqjE